MAQPYPLPMTLWIVLGAAAYYLLFLLPFRKTHWILQDPNVAEEQPSR